MDTAKLKQARQCRTIVDILSEPDADRGYTRKELAVATGRSLKNVYDRAEVARTAGDVDRIRLLVDGKWTWIYYLPTKANIKFFEGLNHEG